MIKLKQQTTVSFKPDFFYISIKAGGQQLGGSGVTVEEAIFYTLTNLIKQHIKVEDITWAETSADGEFLFRFYKTRERSHVGSTLVITHNYKQTKKMITAAIKSKKFLSKYKQYQKELVDNLYEDYVLLLELSDKISEIADGK